MRNVPIDEQRFAAKTIGLLEIVPGERLRHWHPEADP